MSAPKIRIEAVSVRHADAGGRRRTTLEAASLDVGAGELVALLGPSGCGKTTLLNVLAGFLPASSGRVLIDGKEVKRPDPRHVTIFQEYGLYPWRNVLGNVLFGLEAQRVPAADAERRAREALELVGLRAAAERFPHQLSGGMKQRVALARALVVAPDVLFMDEPFGALDTFTRFRLQDEIRRIRLRQAPTIVFVTHDFDEAAYLADRVVIMSADPGRIAEVIDFAPGDSTSITRDSVAFERRRAQVLHATQALFGSESPAPFVADSEEGASQEDSEVAFALENS